ncbi:MAG: ATP-binding protein [Caldilineaceae bacterium]|nr:ATP-binding protein [Caldilineaceae bacterium]
MTYSDEEIRRRLRLGEDSAWAFKRVEFSGDRPTSPRRDDWANEVVAFANATGGALLCGVSDDGDVQTMSRWQPGFRQVCGLGWDGRFPAVFHLTSTSYHYLTKSPMKRNIYESFVKYW